MLGAGDLKWRIDLETRTGDADAGGAPVPQYAPLQAGTPAKYMPKSGGEVWVGTGPTPQQEAEFTVRFSNSVSSLKAKDRLLFEGRSWDILDVRPEGYRQWLVITAKLRNANRGTI